MARVSKCCCCVPLKTGAYAIGCIHVFGLLVGLIQMQPLTVSLEAFCGCTFLVMVYKDAPQKRLFYFTAYVVYAFMLGVTRMIFTFWERDEKEIVSDFCNAINDAPVEEGGKPADIWSKTEYDSLEDCKHKIGTTVMRDEFVSLLFTLIV